VKGQLKKMAIQLSEAAAATTKNKKQKIAVILLNLVITYRTKQASERASIASEMEIGLSE